MIQNDNPYLVKLLLLQEGYDINPEWVEAIANKVEDERVIGCIVNVLENAKEEKCDSNEINRFCDILLSMAYTAEFRKTDLYEEIKDATVGGLKTTLLSFDLKKCGERLALLECLVYAIEHRMEIFSCVADSDTVEDGKKRLMKEFSLTESQAQCIIDGRLRMYTKTEQDKIREEYEDIKKDYDKKKRELESLSIA